jgi:hypothetical protein
LPIYTDQFYVMDPGVPPAVGTRLTMVRLDVNDINNNGIIRASNNDTVGGLRVTSVWQNDTITITVGSVTRTIVGVTFYRSGGPAVFTPTDGSVLPLSASFVRSTFVSTSTQVLVPAFGPACFLRGTSLATPQGERPIETLRAGDLVMTRDHGPKPIVWVGQTKASGLGADAPVRFERGSIGNDRPLLVSPMHRMLISDWRAQLYFGAQSVFVHAKHLVNGKSIRIAAREKACYFHVMFDAHEIVQAHGAASESFYPGDVFLLENPIVAAQIYAIYPELANAGAQWPLARRMLRAHEAVLLNTSFGQMCRPRLDAQHAMGMMRHHVQNPVLAKAHSAQIIAFAPRTRSAA